MYVWTPDWQMTSFKPVNTITFFTPGTLFHTLLYHYYSWYTLNKYTINIPKLWIFNSLWYGEAAWFSSVSLQPWWFSMFSVDSWFVTKVSTYTAWTKIDNVFFRDNWSSFEVYDFKNRLLKIYNWSQLWRYTSTNYWWVSLPSLLSSTPNSIYRFSYLAYKTNQVSLGSWRPYIQLITDKYTTNSSYVPDEQIIVYTDDLVNVTNWLNDYYLSGSWSVVITNTTTWVITTSWSTPSTSYYWSCFYSNFLKNLTTVGDLTVSCLSSINKSSTWFAILQDFLTNGDVSSSSMTNYTQAYLNGVYTGVCAAAADGWQQMRSVFGTVNIQLALWLWWNEIDFSNIYNKLDSYRCDSSYFSGRVNGFVFSTGSTGLTIPYYTGFSSLSLWNYTTFTWLGIDIPVISFAGCFTFDSVRNATDLSFISDTFSCVFKRINPNVSKSDTYWFWPPPAYICTVQSNDSPTFGDYIVYLLMFFIILKFFPLFFNNSN